MRYFVMSLLFAVSAGLAGADSSVPDSKKPAPRKGQAGAPCKVDTDCDQSGDEDLTCHNKKCEIKRPRVMPNT